MKYTVDFQNHHNSWTVDYEADSYEVHEGSLYLYKNYVDVVPSLYSTGECEITRRYPFIVISPNRWGYIKDDNCPADKRITPQDAPLDKPLPDPLV